MELSRLQEEILTCLCWSDRDLCEAEILEKLNCDRSKEWKQVSQPLLNKTLSRSLQLELVEVSGIDTQSYNRKYYAILDLGIHCLGLASSNRKRLGDPRIVPLQ